MLDELALTLSGWDETALTVIGVAIMSLGFIIGLKVRGSSTSRMPRALYFFFGATLTAIASALSYIWLASFDALMHGVFWMLWVVTAGVTLVLGYIYGVIAHARSIDGYGNGRSAWMAIIPIANLVLFFKPPFDARKTRAFDFSASLFLVLAGLSMLGGSRMMLADAERRIDEATQRGENDPQFQQVNLERMLRQRGLDVTLRLTAEQVVSHQVDEITTLLQLEAQGATLRYVYMVSRTSNHLPLSFHSSVMKNNCADVGLRTLMSAGATVEHRYQRRDGTKIGTITATRQDCEAIEVLVQQANSGPKIAQLVLERVLQNEGLEATLMTVAADVARRQVDEITMLLRAEAHEASLSYVFQVTSGPSFVKNFAYAQIKHNVCVEEFDRLLIKAGATIELRYLRPDDTEIDVITVTPQDCEF